MILFFCAEILPAVLTDICVPALIIVLPSSAFISSVGVWPISSWGSPLSTFVSIFLYGVSIKPNSLVLAYVASETKSPMLGPSGVSIGQILP